MNASLNPFATGRVERLLAFDPGLIGTSWAEIEERWASLGHRACVTGHHGSGKTTFVDAMAKRLARVGRVERLFFNDSTRGLSDADRKVLDACGGAFLLVDGDEHLPWRERRELMRGSIGARACLFARHRRRGLPELLRLKSDPVLAKRLLERISPEWGAILGGELSGRLQKNSGNLRELWLECFDLAGKGDFN